MGAVTGLETVVVGGGLGSCVGIATSQETLDIRDLRPGLRQAFAAVVTGKPGRVKPPVDDITAVLDPRQIAAVQSRLTYAAIGGRDTVRDKLAAFAKQTGVDEVMVTGMVFDLDDRIRSLEITAEAVAGL